jgi:hypothetical protein
MRTQLTHMWTALQMAVSSAFRWLARQNRVFLLVVFTILAAMAVLQTVEWMVSRASLPFIQTSQQAQDKARQFEAAARRAAAYADSVERIVVVREQEVVTLKRDVQRLRRALPDPAVTAAMKSTTDSVYAALPDSVKETPGIIPLQHALIQRQDSSLRVLLMTVAKQDTTIAKQDTTIRDITAVRDSLRVALERRVTHKPDRFLGVVPMPSRKTAFVAGLVGGVALTAQLAR